MDILRHDSPLFIVPYYAETMQSPKDLPQKLISTSFSWLKKKKKDLQWPKPKEMTWKTRQEKSKVLGGKERMMERSGLSAQSLFDK